MSDRTEFEKWYDEATNHNYGVAYYVDITGKYCFYDVEIAWQAWQAARAQGDAKPMALLRREIGESSWFDHTPVRPNTKEAELLKASPIVDYCEVYTHPQPAKQVRVPEGWKLVPVEPDEYMCNAGISAFCGGGRVFQAMVNAAPQPPQEGE
jgi:hypothetical protein